MDATSNESPKSFISETRRNNTKLPPILPTKRKAPAPSATAHISLSAEHMHVPPSSQSFPLTGTKGANECDKTATDCAKRTLTGQARLKYDEDPSDAEAVTNYLSLDSSVYSKLWLRLFCPNYKLKDVVELKVAGTGEQLNQPGEQAWQSTDPNGPFEKSADAPSVDNDITLVVGRVLGLSAVAWWVAPDNINAARMFFFAHEIVTELKGGKLFRLLIGMIVAPIVQCGVACIIIFMSCLYLKTLNDIPDIITGTLSLTFIADLDDAIQKVLAFRNAGCPVVTPWRKGDAGSPK
eukprot:gene20132-26863_t